MRSTQGLTLIETVVAIAICAIVLGTLATVSSNSLRESRAGNFKTQATQILGTLGRRVAGGLDSTLLPAAGEILVLDSTAVEELTDVPPSTAAGYAVTIQHAGFLTVAGSSLSQYQLSVCYSAVEGQRCVAGATVGR